MRRPDYIVIGAMKCGTSTLAAQLGAQTGLFMTDPKEPNYFSDDENFARGPDWYSGLFAAAASDDLLGEASTHYTKRPDYPQTIARLKASVPAPRLVYMIRDPIARLVSHYVHIWSEGETGDPIGVALEKEPRLVDYGRYGWQITPFVEAFGPEAILLTSLERLTAAPQAELTRIAAHIGHTGPVAWQEDVAAQNVSARRVRKLPFHELLINHPLSSALRRSLVPKSVRTYIRNRRRITVSPEVPAAARPGLEARFAEDRSVLETCFPEDPSLKLAYPFLS